MDVATLKIGPLREKHILPGGCKMSVLIFYSDIQHSGTGSKTMAKVCILYRPIGNI